MPTNHLTESAHFKSFRYFARDVVPDGPVTHAGAFEVPAPDGAPDFRITTPDRTLGIELRELLKQDDPAKHSERAEEGYIDDVLQIGQEMTELRGKPRARVSLMFDSGVPGTRVARIAIARKLSDLVSRHMPEDGEHADLDWGLLREAGIHCVSRIMIHRDDRQYRTGIWNAPQAGMVLSNCTDILRKAIASKAAKYASYRKYCDDCWLVLVADSARPSASIHPDERSLTNIYMSPFERTYFLDYGMGRLHLLRTSIAN